MADMGFMVLPLTLPVQGSAASSTGSAIATIRRYTYSVGALAHMRGCALRMTLYTPFAHPKQRLDFVALQYHPGQECPSCGQMFESDALLWCGVCHRRPSQEFRQLLDDLADVVVNRWQWLPPLHR